MPSTTDPKGPGFPYSAFARFYDNPAIARLAPSPRWTVSFQLDVTKPQNKAPLDVRELHANHRIRGAFEKTANCLMTLPELVDFLPRAANHAFALNAQLDRVLVLDIEKTCPPDVARELLALPHLYSEVSMSGKGYHLLMDLPDVFDDFPVAAGKVALREEHGWYEVLLDHWITFTRTPATDMPAPLPAEVGRQAWNTLYAGLAANAVATRVADIEVTATKPEIPGESDALHVMTSRALPKTLADFHGDNSRYEFSLLSTFYRRLAPAIPYLSECYGLTYTDSMKAWLLYEAIVASIPHRPKHDETRNGMPMLLDRATALLARREADRHTEHGRR